MPGTCRIEPLPPIMVGDYATVPMRICYPDPAFHVYNPGDPGLIAPGTPSDYYYADLSYPDALSWDLDGDGYLGEYSQDSPDFLADVAVGRIPVNFNLYGDPAVDVAGAVVDVADRGAPGPGSHVVSTLPSPFASSVTLRLRLTTAEPVRITVHDVRGRLVATLADRTCEAGQFAVTWDGTNGRGEQAASDLYFVAVRAGGEQVVRKIVLLEVRDGPRPAFPEAPPGVGTLMPRAVAKHILLARPAPSVYDPLHFSPAWWSARVPVG